MTRLSNRAWFWLMILHAALYAWIGHRGFTPAWVLTGLFLGLSVTYLGLWLRDRDHARDAALEAQSADRAPATFATWPCPDCGDDVPVTFHTQRIVIAHPNPTDIHAHRLAHQETP